MIGVVAKDFRHGTRSGYSYHGCRCDECTAASKAYSRSRQELKPRKPPREPMPIPHGTESGYGHHKCRCDDCKSARREYIRRRREEKPEAYREYRRRSYENSYEREAQTRQRFRAANPEYRRNHYEANREKTAEYTRRWRTENPEKIRELRSVDNHRRRSRMREAFVEDVSPIEVFERDNWKCQIPGCIYPDEPARMDVGRYDPLLASLDHVIPLSRGGKHERDNLTCSHLQCNQKKHTRVEGIA